MERIELLLDIIKELREHNDELADEYEESYKKLDSINDTLKKTIEENTKHKDTIDKLLKYKFDFHLLKNEKRKLKEEISRLKRNNEKHLIRCNHHCSLCDDDEIPDLPEDSTNNDYEMNYILSRRMPF